MNAKTTATIAVAVVALMVFAAAGATTYSWFSDSQDTDITVTTAVIDVDVVVDGMKFEDGKYSAEINNVASNWVFNETPLSYKIINASSIDTAVRTFVDVSIIDADKKSLSDVDAIKDVKENFVLQFGKESTDMGSYGLVNGRTVLNDWAVNPVGVADDTYYFNLYTSEAFETQGLTIEIEIVTEALQVDAPRDVTTDAAFKEAVTANTENIVVDLMGDVTYDVAAWADDAMGGEITKTITINGNGHKVTFHQTNSDWNNIVTNGAKLILNDMEITSSGYNDGPWNRHDLNFACDVEMNDVFSDKALAFKAGATLKNVTIDDPNTSDTYAIWIQPNGQTVSLDGCTIDMIDCTDGRGIKIDNQYVDAENEAKVTLIVKDTIFKTEEKSAILVKSTVGADIELVGVNITGVKADKINAVWVDEATKDYANLVTVDGGLMKVEGSSNTPFVNNGNINLPTGNYSLPTLSGLTGVTINGVIGGTIVGGEDVSTGFGSNFGKDTTIKNMIFNGSTNGVRYSYAQGGTSTFDNCRFEGGSTYGFHIDQSNGATFIFNNCTFVGFNAFAGDLVKVTFNNCTFLSNGNYGHTNIWSVGEFNDCIWGDNSSVGIRGNGKLYFNGVEESYYHEFIGSKESLFNFAKSVNEGGDAWADQKVLLVADIDLNDEVWTPIGQTGATEFRGIFDGQNYTIKNLKVDSSKKVDEHYSSGLFGWCESGATIKNVRVDGANVVGNHNVAVIVGYTYSIKIANCHVSNANIVCNHANGDACGDKCGIIVGYMGDEARMSECSAKDCTVKAGRDAGQLVGRGYNVSMEGNSATNVSVTATGECTGANINESLIGRVMG